MRAASVATVASPRSTPASKPGSTPIIGVVISSKPILAAPGATSPVLHVQRSGYYAAFYAQDTWNATRKLTLNYGFRADLYKQSQDLGQKGVNTTNGSPR